MVPSPGVLLTARRGVRHVQISPVANVLQRLAAEVHTGPSGLVALAYIPLVANVAGRKLPLLLFLTALAAFGAGARRLKLRGLAFHVGPCPNKIVPISGQLSCGEDSFPIPPVVGVFRSARNPQIDTMCAPDWDQISAPPCKTFCSTGSSPEQQNCSSSSQRNELRTSL